MQVSKYVSLEEIISSPTAVANKIDNTPTEAQLAAIKLTAINVFDKLREWVGGPIKINSSFRSLKLNEKVGGSATSQHCANNGAAFDIDDTYGKKTNKEMFHYIKDNLDFDQLIAEFGTDTNPDWVHFSYKESGNRKEVLKAVKVNGKTKYINYE